MNETKILQEFFKNKYKNVINKDIAILTFIYFKHIKKCSQVYDFCIENRIGFRVAFNDQLRFSTVMPFHIYERWSPKEFYVLLRKLDEESILIACVEDQGTVACYRISSHFS